MFMIRILRILYSLAPENKYVNFIVTKFGMWSVKHKRKKRLTFRSREGTIFRIDLSEKMHKYLFIRGTYEPGLSRFFRMNIRPDDVVFDVGANFGWFSVLFLKLLDKRGSLHSFEPVPPIYEELKQNIALNKGKIEPKLNNFALGAKKTRTEINVFKNLPHGHASLSDLGREDASTYDTEIITLDHYIEKYKIRKVDVIKIDVEGAEFNVLRGAEKLLKNNPPRIITMEVNYRTSRFFGYSPLDMLEYLRSFGYRIYALGLGGKQAIKDWKSFKHGDVAVAEHKGDTIEDSKHSNINTVS